jgi:hypothetical protein
VAKQYNLYWRMKGAMEFWCPNCHSFNKAYVSYRTVTVQCTNKECQRVYAFGFYLMRTNPGHHNPPPDRIAPLFDEVFPERWRSGQPANRYVLGSDDDKPNTPVLDASGAGGADPDASK